MEKDEPRSEPARASGHNDSAEDKQPEPEADESPREKPHEFIAPRESRTFEKPEFKAEPATDAEPISASRSWLGRLKNWYLAHKLWSIPLSVLALVLILALVPWTRYHLGALALKKDFAVQVLDSKTNSPVSGATVFSGSASAETDANGRATLHSLKVGNHSVSVAKKYYKDGQATVLVPILKAKSSPSVALEATGRQVKITVTDVVTTTGLSGVDIKVADITAKTDKDGNAAVVLPAGAASQKASLSSSGFNKADVTVQVDDKTVKENKFSLTPAGKIYFLTTRTGKLDVMKVDLDGKNAELVLAGTGHEDENNTSLVASPDWRYLALRAKRTADANPQVYIINAATDKTNQIDEGNASFELEGWVGNTLIYTVQRNDLHWEAGRNKVKSYNATNGLQQILDQSSGVGDANAFGYEYYTNTFIIGGNVIFAKNWTTVWDSKSYAPAIDLGGKQNTLVSIGADGKNRQNVSAFDAKTITPTYSRSSPNGIYIWQHNINDSTDNFLNYSPGSAPKSVSISTDQFYKQRPTWYLSPNDKQAFWVEVRDGKNTLLLGDGSAENGKTLASGSDYTTYGWFTDKYLLVSKDANELGIMGIGGGNILKVTSYQAGENYKYRGY